MDASDVVILLLDHQTGLFQTVKDISVSELRSKTIMLAKLATLPKLPVITTASEPNGPNGPLMPEIPSRTTVAHFIQAGVIPTSTNAVLSEMHRAWNRPEAAELAKLYALVGPNYAAVIESYQKAREAAKQTVGAAAK
jgi:hypothetical protein